MGHLELSYTCACCRPSAQTQALADGSEEDPAAGAQAPEQGSRAGDSGDSPGFHSWLEVGSACLCLPSRRVHGWRSWQAPSRGLM